MNTTAALRLQPSCYTQQQEVSLHVHMPCGITLACLHVQPSVVWN
jgi:hypothetical protein